MATPFTYPVTAAQIGTYFVNHYYHYLQQKPDIVHQYYTDVSTMLRIDSHTRETASAMLQIHNLIMSLSYTEIEIKTAHSLESWNGGLLVMVSGSLRMKNFANRRKFVQTFFLAPQEKGGFFVLNDIFHFIEDELVLQHPAVLLATDLDSKLNISTSIPEPVSNYMRGGEIHAGNFVAPAEENGQVETYNFEEQQLHHVSQTENESNGLLQNTVHAVQEPLPPAVPIEGETQKHTYASILRVSKGQSGPLASLNQNQNTVPASSEWQSAPQLTIQQSISSSSVLERSGSEAAEEVSAEDEGEIKSVYVRNLPSNVSASEIEEQFKKFGKLKADEGVVIRSRKDVGVCYAFVEFEDITGVQNAIKEASVQIGGRQAYIEERRGNRNNGYRGGRQGRGRGSYQSDGPRGRFGGHYGLDGGEQRDYRPRGNGYYRRQDRGGYTGNQVSRNGRRPSS